MTLIALTNLLEYEKTFLSTSFNILYLQQHKLLYNMNRHEKQSQYKIGKGDLRLSRTVVLRNKLFFHSNVIKGKRLWLFKNGNWSFSKKNFKHATYMLKGYKKHQRRKRYHWKRKRRYFLFRTKNKLRTFLYKYLRRIKLLFTFLRRLVLSLKNQRNLLGGSSIYNQKRMFFIKAQTLYKKLFLLDPSVIGSNVLKDVEQNQINYIGDFYKLFDQNIVGRGNFDI